MLPRKKFFLRSLLKKIGEFSKLPMKKVGKKRNNLGNKIGRPFS
jgi:hypothetical protein